MTCQEFARRLGDYVDDDMSTDARSEYDRHAASCRDCTAYLQSYRLTIRIAQVFWQDRTARPRQTSFL